MALNVNMVNKKSEKASLLALANVEALAQGESGSGGFPGDWQCSTITVSESTYSDCGGRYVINQLTTDNWCDDGLYGSCIMGAITYFYNCDGTLGNTYNSSTIRNCVKS